MKLGISTYSLHQQFKSGKMTVTDMVEFIASLGAEHVEIVPLDYNLLEQSELIQKIKDKASECGIEISNYAIGANFANLTDEDYAKEIERVKKEVDVAAALGVRRMRHDVAAAEDISISNFLMQLPHLTKACKEIARYARRYEIVTSIENHGYFVQHSERIQALIHSVNEENFKTTLDIGNFLCADESPLVAVKNNIGFASMIHVKDFLYRPAARNPGEGWFQTTGGNWLRGTIVGHGDIDIPQVLTLIKQSGYDGYMSIEFEGMEECKEASRLAFEYVRRVWNELP